MAGQIEAAKRALWNLLKSRKEGLSAKLTITTANGSLKVTLEQSFPPHHSNVDSSKLKKSKKVKKSQKKVRKKSKKSKYKIKKKSQKSQKKKSKK